MKPGWNREDLAYCAGFFDGEGCISIQLPCGTSFYLLKCSVVNTDVRPLERFSKLFGGSVKGPYNRGVKCKPVFVWCVEASRAENFLKSIFNFLVIKRERAEKALSFRLLFKGENVLPRGKSKMSDPRHIEKRDSVIDLRRIAYEEMRSLNKRGINNVECN